MLLWMMRSDLLLNQVTDPSSAVVGGDNEGKVLLERSHYQLGYILGHRQREYMEGVMQDAVIRTFPEIVAYVVQF
jgi:hypothetical protein